jgi:hypothetical protein
MNKDVTEALADEMPSIIEYVNRIFASNPTLRKAGFRYQGLLVNIQEQDTGILSDHKAFKAFIRSRCHGQKLCRPLNGGPSIIVCTDEDCPPGYE